MPRPAHTGPIAHMHEIKRTKKISPSELSRRIKIAVEDISDVCILISAKGGGAHFFDFDISQLRV